MIKEIYISENTTDLLVKILDSLVENKLVIPYNSSASQNAEQTNNLCKNQFMLPILRNISNEINFEKQLYYRWFHMISYDHLGYQQKHDHSATEDFSFILYLKSCDRGGETFFELPNGEIKSVKPIKNKLIFFPSHLTHWGGEVINEKKVAVGALIVQ